VVFVDVLLLRLLTSAVACYRIGHFPVIFYLMFDAAYCLFIEGGKANTRFNRSTLNS